MIVLFVCLGNIERSPKGAKIFKKLALEKKLDVEVSSAGLELYKDLSPQELKEEFSNDLDHTPKIITQELADKTDIIFVMENYMKEKIIENFKKPEDKIITLNVFQHDCTDISNLYKILEEKLKPYIKQFSENSLKGDVRND